MARTLQPHRLEEHATVMYYVYILSSCLIVIKRDLTALHKPSIGMSSTDRGHVQVVSSPPLSEPLLPQRLDVDKREDDMIQHRNCLGRNIEVGWMRLFQNPKILLMEADEMDIRLDGFQLSMRPIVITLFNKSKRTYPTMRRLKLPLVYMPVRTYEIPATASIKSSTPVNIASCHQNTRESTYVLHTRFSSITSAGVTFPSNRNTVSFNRCHSMTPIVSGTPLGPLRRYLVIVVTFLNAQGVDMV